MRNNKKGIYMDHKKREELIRLINYYMNKRQLTRVDAIYEASKKIWEEENLVMDQ
ncbi:MAG TPA: hypothetical protein VES68_02005 [Candidatus Sulfotelmatobacter sp.]|nr:hypothetical protein [Candidatus Sulfotelmatobacter sp.]